MNTSKYIVGDIHKELLLILDGSIDFVYTNPPFATTNKKWDTPLNWEYLFPEMERVLKDNGAIALHCAIPFTYDLMAVRKPKYHYTWTKSQHTNPFLSRIQPLRNVEEILIYYNKQPTYNAQMIGDEIFKSKTLKTTKSGYYQHSAKGLGKEYVSTERVGRFPTTYLGVFNRKLQLNSPKSIDDKITEQMILTYTNENDTILDMTCCDRNNGDIAVRLKRNYIGVDISDEFL